jgi:exosortase
VGIVLAALVMRLAGLHYDYVSLERYAFVLALAGCMVVLLGWRTVIRFAWVGMFLLLMIPLPGRLHSALSLPLQEFATRSAVFGLELLGCWATREGNVILLGESSRVAVAEACSGLRMMVAFVFVSALIALIVPRPAWHKALLMALSLPTAVACNSLRLITTALVYSHTQDEAVEAFIHDFAGILMMPVAVAASLGGLWLLGLMQGRRTVSSVRNMRGTGCSPVTQ